MKTVATLGCQMNYGNARELLWMVAPSTKSQKLQCNKPAQRIRNMEAFYSLSEYGSEDRFKCLFGNSRTRTTWVCRESRLKSKKLLQIYIWSSFARWFS